MPTYAKGYKYDVFVSYARVDNQPVKGIQVGWVSHLVDTLELILAKELGRSELFEVWMDVKGARTVPSIIDRVKVSATFLMILSPGYLASPSCGEELECFKNLLGAQPDNDLSRIFVAETTPRRRATAPTPDDLEKVIRYEFWYEDDNSRIRTRGLPTFDLNDRVYYNTIQDIAVDIIDELDRLNGAAVGAAP